MDAQKVKDTFEEAGTRGYLKVPNTQAGRELAGRFTAYCEDKNIPKAVLTTYRSRSHLTIDVDPLPGNIVIDSSIAAPISDYVDTVRADAKARDFSKLKSTPTTLEIKHIPQTHDDLVTREVIKMLYNAKGLPLPAGVK